MSDKPLNLAQRMLAVTKAVGPVEKGGEFKGGSKAGNYAYHRFDDVDEAIRDHLVNFGVVVYPTVAEHKTEINKIQKSGNNGSYEQVQIVVEAVVDVTFANADDPNEKMTLRCFGQGIDFSDKGPGKAISYALKTLYLAVFHLRGNPDSEDDGNNRQVPQDRSEPVKPNPAIDPDSDYIATFSEDIAGCRSLDKLKVFVEEMADECRKGDINTATYDACLPLASARKKVLEAEKPEPAQAS